MIKESREKNRLLIADDSKMNREILKEILGDEYIVTEAKDGTEAIELLKKEEDSFSALLLDLNMPETNGYQVLEWMNEEYVIERIPVIVILADLLIDSHHVNISVYDQKCKHQYQPSGFVALFRTGALQQQQTQRHK